jgi:hypothetical protein
MLLPEAFLPKLLNTEMNKQHPKINFFCVGAQKAGTTSLHDILKTHPQLFLPKHKEAHFFNLNGAYSKGFDWYMKEFYSDYSGQKTVGNINPDYLHFEFVPERILASVGPEVKFIFMLRNPMDRAYSHYLMSLGRGQEDKDFMSAIQHEQDRVKQSVLHEIRFKYIGRGRYFQQIQWYLEKFTPGNMKFIIFEDFIREKEKTIDAILEFIGLEKVALDYSLKSNAATEPRNRWLRDLLRRPMQIKKMLGPLVPREYKNKLVSSIEKRNSKPLTANKALPIALKKQLYEQYYKEDISQLEILLGRPLTQWYTFDK